MNVPQFQSNSVHIGFIGDLIQSPELKVDPRLRERLRSTDFNVANLEAPFIDTTCRPLNGRSGVHQRRNDCAVLHDLNIHAVSLANNHMPDFGGEGIRLTRGRLAAEGIAAFGAGMNRAEAMQPAEIETAMGRFAFWGFMFNLSLRRFGFATLDKPGVAEFQPANASLGESNAAHKIVFNHWHQEFEDYPEPLFKEQGRRLLERCALIVGSHPHCVHGIEMHLGKYIFHSLGNFSMPRAQYLNCQVGLYRGKKSYQGFVPIVEFNRTGVERFSIVPYSIDPTGTQISLMPPEEEQAFRAKLETLSDPLTLEEAAYRRFYRRHKIRPLRFTLSRSPLLNKVLSELFLLFAQAMRLLELATVTSLEVLGIRQFVRSRFRRVIDQIYLWR
ncbi:MAG: CapA family protein [Verrucomicrobiota bacterium]